MEIAFILSGENLDLAEAEAVSLLGLTKYRKHGNVLLANMGLAKESLYDRLAMTKKILEVIVFCETGNLEDELQKLQKSDIKNYYEESFSFRSFRHGAGKGISEKKAASIIYGKLDDPSVDLKNPKTRFEAHFKDENAFMGKLIWENKDDFNARKAHKRPKLHPSSINPKVAKACVNLLGIMKGEVVDPFCGSGGILIEAALMGLDVIGYDIDKGMLERSSANLKHYGIKKFTLSCLDSTKLKKRINYVVTDMPYGKNTRSEGINDVYMGFSDYLRRSLGKRAVIVYSGFDMKGMLEERGLNVENHFRHYVHGSMMRDIIIVKGD